MWDLVIEVEFCIAFFAMLVRWVGNEALPRCEDLAQDGMHLHHLLPTDRLVELDHDAYG